MAPSSPEGDGSLGVWKWVELDFFRGGTSTDNAVVESFNGRLRQEGLNERWFLSLTDARRNIGAWRTFYSEDQPHTALAWKTPSEFARECGAKPPNRDIPYFKGGHYDY